MNSSKPFVEINYNTDLQKICDPFIKESGVSVFVKREDLNHPLLSGNKYHKLKYNLDEAEKKGYKTLLTFGGAYSNHIYATAAAGKIFGLKTIGIIRGEEHLPLNPTLSFAKECGMRLFYLNRKSYRKKHEDEIINLLKDKFGDFYLIPEGGTNELAVKGCSEIINTIDIDFDYICCPCGTGGTLAGLAAGIHSVFGNADNKKKAIGFSVLKGAGFLQENIRALLNSYLNKESGNWQINLDYHFGGYAKINRVLIDFINNFQSENNIPLEPVYTGKMMFGIYDLVKKGFFSKGKTIIALHTGGLQGLPGLSEKIKKLSLRTE